MKQQLRELRDASRLLFVLRGDLPKTVRIPLEISGLALLLLVWWLIIKLGLANEGVFPKPWSVVKSIPELHFQDYLVRNMLTSIKLNLMGYSVAVAIAVPLGFLLGLTPLFRGLFERHIVALRFLPMTALIGTFITWFGIGSVMKFSFLATCIVVYLVPTTIQRIDEVEQNYVDIIRTLGGKTRHVLRHVFIPAALARISDDIRVLVAISWTYIVFAEVVNKSEGGLGALIFTAGRQSRITRCSPFWRSSS